MRKQTLAWAVVATFWAASASFAADFVKGKVVEVDEKAGTVTLEHGDIPNLDMPGMIMTFRIGAGIDATELTPGSIVEFTAESVDDAVTVTEIRGAPQ